MVKSPVLEVMCKENPIFVFQADALALALLDRASAIERRMAAPAVAALKYDVARRGGSTLRVVRARAFLREMLLCAPPAHGCF